MRLDDCLASSSNQQANVSAFLLFRLVLTEQWLLAGLTLTHPLFGSRRTACLMHGCVHLRVWCLPPVSPCCPTKASSSVVSAMRMTREHTKTRHSHCGSARVPGMSCVTGAHSSSPPRGPVSSSPSFQAACYLLPCLPQTLAAKPTELRGVAGCPPAGWRGAWEKQRVPAQLQLHPRRSLGLMTCTDTMTVVTVVTM